MNLNNETRVLLAKTGELLLATPVYTNQICSILPNDVVNGLLQEDDSIGVFVHSGYLVYHPTLEGDPMFFNIELNEYVEDLGIL